MVYYRTESTLKTGKSPRSEKATSAAGKGHKKEEGKMDKKKLKEMRESTRVLTRLLMSSCWLLTATTVREGGSSREIGYYALLAATLLVLDTILSPFKLPKREMWFRKRGALLSKIGTVVALWIGALLLFLGYDWRPFGELAAAFWVWENTFQLLMTKPFLPKVKPPCLLKVKTLLRKG